MRLTTRIARTTALALVACGAPTQDAGPPRSLHPGPGRTIETDAFSLPMPAGYQDLTATYQRQQPDVLAALSGQDARGAVVAIILTRAQLPTWIVEPARCEEHARTVVFGGVPGGTYDDGSTLRRATVIDWAGAKACEIDFVAAQAGPSLATERLDPVRPDDEGWMMLCQHNDDPAALAACRATRDQLVLKRQPR